MATEATIKKVFATVFFKFPSRKPTKEEDGKLAFDIWSAAYKSVSDAALLAAIARFTVEVAKIYPDDDPFAMIMQTAQPILPETEGDCIELVDEAVRRFGWPNPEEAMNWIAERSPLVAAAVRRIGFLEYCKCEEPDVIRGQLRAIFRTEKQRSKELGGIMESATELQGGQADVNKLLGLTQNIIKGQKALSVTKRAA
jgi:hypothetical protein